MYQIKRKQIVKCSLSECWDFFSSPKNLQAITPDYMKFKIRTDLPEKMYEGMMIEYTVCPVLGIPLNWLTEIKTVKEGDFFVDEQRKGPYKIWHHEHHFKETDEGIEMTDIVSYELPFGIFGKIMHPILVQSKLESIFNYRFERVEQLFNQKPVS